jgi:hypothetical protein
LGGNLLLTIESAVETATTATETKEQLVFAALVFTTVNTDPE